ncbi:MAG: TolC family protein [Treponema sp.]|nr:TolC family protein [Treponema sp.]
MKRFFLIVTFLIFSFPLFSYTLDELKALLLQNNPELLKLNQEYEQAKLDLKDAKAGLGPSIDLQVSGTYMLNPPVDAIYLNVDDVLNSIQWGEVLGTSGVRPVSSGQSIKIYDGMENTLYNFQLSLTQPLFTWGKLENAVKLYKQVVEIKQTQIESQLQQKETELEIRLVSLYYLQKIVEILEEEKVFAQRLVETSENAEKSGMLLHQDVVEARIQAKELEIAQQDIAEQIKNQFLELERTCGLEGLTRGNIDYAVDEVELAAIMALNRAEAEERALSGQQLSIKMLSQLKNVNELAEKIARGYVNWKPDLALQASAGYGGSRFPFTEPNWRRKDDYSLNVSLGIKTTIWDGGKKLNDVSRKISEAKVADINQLDARSTIKQTLNKQWNTVDVCTMKIEYQELKLEAADSKIKQKETIFQSGYGSETDVLNAKIDRCNQLIEKERQSLTRSVACLTIKALVE